MVKNLLFLMICPIILFSQILECRIIDNEKAGLQLANLNFEKLRSKNGTVYNKVSSIEKDNIVSFFASTDIGAENIALVTKPTWHEPTNMNYYFGYITIVQKNGLQTEAKTYCYDLNVMNALRAKRGLPQSTIAVQEW